MHSRLILGKGQMPNNGKLRKQQRFKKNMNYRRRDELENNIKRNSGMRKIKLDFEFKTH